MTGYNGWKNYETWVVALWIDNDQSTYNYSRELAQEYRMPDGAKYPLADALKSWVVNDLIPDVSGLAGDLLGAALDEVNWFEIAENYLSEE